MPGSTAFGNPVNTSAAAIQAWASLIAAGLVTAGMVKTTDTGQTAPGSLTTSATTQATLGYEIYRFNDSLQATNPLFLRVMYRNGSGVAYPALSVQAGTATDGAGNLTSASGHLNTVTGLCNVLDPSNNLYGFNGTSFPVYSFGHSDGAAVAQLVFPNTTSGTYNYGGGFLLERSRDPDGTPSGRGFVLGTWTALNANTYSSWHQAMYSWTGSQIGSMSSGLIPYSTQVSSVVDGSGVYPWPVFTGYTPRVNGPSKILAVAGRTDVPVGVSYPMTHYGEAGTWVSAGAANTSQTSGYGSFGGGLLSSPQMRLS